MLQKAWQLCAYVMLQWTGAGLHTSSFMEVPVSETRMGPGLVKMQPALPLLQCTARALRTGLDVWSHDHMLLLLLWLWCW
jgi:hypothetical protein